MSYHDLEKGDILECIGLTKGIIPGTEVLVLRDSDTGKPVFHAEIDGEGVILRKEFFKKTGESDLDLAEELEQELLDQDDINIQQELEDDKDVCRKNNLPSIRIPSLMKKPFSGYPQTNDLSTITIPSLMKKPDKDPFEKTPKVAFQNVEQAIRSFVPIAYGARKPIPPNYEEVSSSVEGEYVYKMIRYKGDKHERNAITITERQAASRRNASKRASTGCSGSDEGSSVTEESSSEATERDSSRDSGVRNTTPGRTGIPSSNCPVIPIKDEGNVMLLRPLRVA